MPLRGGILRCLFPSPWAVLRGNKPIDMRRGKRCAWFRDHRNLHLAAWGRVTLRVGSRRAPAMGVRKSGHSDIWSPSASCKRLTSTWSFIHSYAQPYNGSGNLRRSNGKLTQPSPHKPRACGPAAQLDGWSSFLLVPPNRGSDFDTLANSSFR